MNFFEHQQEARSNTRTLIIVFILAVVTELGVMGAFAVLIHWYIYEPFAYEHSHLGVFSWAAAATLLAILLGSFVQYMKLRGGAVAVAKGMGATRIHPSTENPRERQLLNVVEEMSIAAGMRVPDLYLLDGEPGINAFAAGFSMSDSLIVVTRGMLDTLNRDEMQGVIGHELSHILHGDAALNTRMLGVLAGLVFVVEVGRGFLRSWTKGIWGAMANLSKSSLGGGCLYLLLYTLPFMLIVLPLLLFIRVITIVLGACIYLIGYIGLIFARLIRAGVSWQREFLADASSVQFTRNPDGVASALHQVQISLHQGYIQHPKAEDYSHMFFGEVVDPEHSSLLFYSHPPLQDRIERINPDYQPDPARPLPHPLPAEEEGAREEGRKPTVRYATGGLPLEAQAGLVMAVASGGLKQQAGNAVTESGLSDSVASLAGEIGDVSAVRGLIDSLPSGLYMKTRFPDSACAIVLAVLLSSKPEVKAGQLKAAMGVGVDDLLEKAGALEEKTRNLQVNHVLPLIDLALPAIKEMSEVMRESFLRAVKAVAHADKRISPREFSVITLLQFQVSGQHGEIASRLHLLKSVRSSTLWLLSMMSHAGGQALSEEEKIVRFNKAFAAGTRTLGFGPAEPVSRDKMTLDAAERAMAQLRMLAPLPKEQLVKALLACVIDDDQINQAESELMRMVCAVLECPLPPMFNMMAQSL